MRHRCGAPRSTARTAGCRANAWPAIRSAGQRVRDRPGAEACAGPTAGWLDGFRKTSGLQLYLGPAAAVIKWYGPQDRKDAGSTHDDRHPMQKRPPQKKRRAQRPGESNREASRLGDVGSLGSRVSNAISRNRSCRRPELNLRALLGNVSALVLDTGMRTAHVSHLSCNTRRYDG